MTDPNPVPPPTPPSDAPYVPPYAPPQPAPGLFVPPYAPVELAPQDQRTMGMLCHLLALCALVGVPLGNLLGPLIIWLVKKDTMPFVDDQGKESLNFQISVAIISILLSPLICLAGIGLLLIIPLVIASLVFSVIGAIKANQGIYYRYPFAIRLIK